MSIKRRILDVGTAREHFVAPESFARDLATVFRPAWHFVGHASELATPGAFVTFRLGDEEAIICRGADTGLRAYHNFCPHRGHRLCTTERGELRRNIVCPYHGWAFSRDAGDCVSAVRMNEDFDRAQYGLQKAWVEDFHGLIFVSFADERPVPVSEATGEMNPDPAGIAGYDVRGMKVAAIIHHEFAANWKILRENDDECYHCLINHPELIEGYDPWAGFTVIDDLDSPRPMWTSDDWALLELGTTYKAKQVCALPAPRTDGREGFDNQDIQFFWQPSGHVVLQRDHAWMWNIMPLAPDRTRLTQHWLVHKDAVEGKDYDLDTLTKLFNVTMLQDKALCEEVQRGLRMRRYTPGPLNPHHQSPAAAFYRWYESRLAGAR